MPPQSSMACNGARLLVGQHLSAPNSKPRSLQKMLAGSALTLCGLFTTWPSLPAQTVLPPVLTQLEQAVLGITPVGKISLSGVVTYHSGGTTDTGQIVLTADTTGESSVKMTLNSLGNKTENIASGPLGGCTWAGQDQVVHKASGLSCWRPMNWFFPALSLQPGSLVVGTTAVDLGTDSSSGVVFRHIQASFSSSELDSATAALLTSESTSDLELDPNTFLPASMAYKVRPDSGAATLIPIIVRYSNYQVIGGVHIPMHIDRLVNGSNQLSIDLTSAAIN